jgi:predicted RNase H-like HicB family nuclease
VASELPLYTARAERDGELWDITVPEVPEAHSKARTQEEAAILIKEAIATVLNIPDESFDVQIDFEGKVMFQYFPPGGGVPMDGLDKLRAMTEYSRTRTAPEIAMEALRLTREAYDFGNEILAAMAMRDMDDPGIMRRVLIGLPSDP